MDTRSFRQPRIPATGGAVIVLVLVASSVAEGASAVTTPDEKRTLVSRDVGGERWAITDNFAEDATVTGNVFFPAGGDPAFVWCEDVSPDPAAPDATYSCFGADRCETDPCPLIDWVFLSEVRLPRSFLEVTEGSSWLPIDESVALPASFFEPPASGEGGARASGLQITPDRARVLISKDVAGARWAITRNLDDATVTGNVFSPEGDEPDFLWCEDASTDDEPGVVRLSCFLAQPGVAPTPTPTPTVSASPSPTPTATATATPTPTPAPSPTADLGLVTGQVCDVLDDRCAAPYVCLLGNPSRCSTSDERYPPGLPGCLATPFSDPCTVGYYCAFDTVVSGICTRKLLEGEACTPLVGAPCTEGTSCEIVSVIPPRAECR